MNSPEPRLNKQPFIITAVVCFTAVVLIGLFAENRFAPLWFLTAVGLLVMSVIALMIPALADYAADSRESSRRLREELETQTARVQSATESLQRAAAQIKAVEEAVQKSARDAETLPYRMQEKLAEFNEALAEKENSDREALETELEELRAANSGQLRAVAEKIGKAVADWTALEAATRKQLGAAQEAAAKIDEVLRRALAEIDTRTEKLLSAASAPAILLARPEPPPSAVPPAPPVAAAAPVPAEIHAPAVSPPAERPAVVSHTVITEPPKPKLARAPRKPKPEDTLAAMSDPVSLPEPAAENSGDPESSASSDGATRLLATAYIGIGNKLFIRGDGPGLSWDRGVPMQFVSIGKWGWSTHDAAGPVRIKLYKNDEVAALSGELHIEPGKHTEATALF